MALSYLELLFFFLMLPITALALISLYRDKDGIWWDRDAFNGLIIIVVIAFLYTTPWDNLMIAEGVWWYGEEAVITYFWEAPLGEYLFFILQPVLTGFLLFHISKLSYPDMNIVTRKNRIQGVAAGLTVMTAGAALMLNQETFYMGSILFWAGPVLAIQWGFGWPYLVKNWKVVATAITVPTLYLWAVDYYAISEGLWIISEAHTTGLAVGVLPVEEMFFFLVTNVFIVQGLVMYRWLCETEGVKNYVRRITGFK